MHLPSPVVHSTFVIERTYPQTPQQVFGAFADAAVKRRWFAESKNHTLEQFDLEFRVGGHETALYRMAESTPFPGAALSSDGVFLDIVPEQRIVSASTMSMEGRCFSASLITFEFIGSEAGTQLVCTHQGAFFEGADGPDMREAGWLKLFAQLESFFSGN